MNWMAGGTGGAFRHWGLMAALLGVATLAGCGGGSKGSASGSGSSGGAVLRVAQQAEPTTLDPAQVQDGPTIELMMHVFDGLVQWNGKNELVPALAEKWDISDGGRTYTFHLHQGVKFHNGRALTAEDFVYSLTRSLSPKVASPVAMVYLNDIVGAREYNQGKASSVTGLSAVDPQTFRIRIDVPKAYFLSKLTYPTAYVVCKEAVEGSGGKIDETSMIGTGPFKVTEYRRGDRIILDPNPAYFEGAPKLTRIERRILLDNGSRRDKYEAGELDIADLSMATYRADKANPELQSQIHQFPRAAVFYLALNGKAYAPFKDKRVRQAIAMAVNRQQIVDSVLEGVPQLAHGIIPVGVPGYNPDFRGLPYDPAKARTLLAQAGFPNGQGMPALTLSFRASVEDIKNTATAVQEDLQQNLGMKVNLDEVEWGTFLSRRNSGAMPFYFLRWSADYLDPQDFLSLMLHTGSPENSLGYSNPEFDRLCESADVMQDPEKRWATYRKAEAIAVDDAPWVPIYFQRDVELWNPKLQGVEDSLMGHLPHKRTYLAP